MALTRVSPALFQVSNNITSVTVGGSANTISLTFDSNGVITSATNNAVSVANTAITGNIISSQIASVSGSVITANTVANSAFQTGSVENYMRAQGVGAFSGMRNRIINGAMLINQRGASDTSAGYALDRWYAYTIAGSKMTIQQASASNPAGFPQAMLVTSSTALSVASNTYYYVGQYIEGFNTSDLAFGTASAKTVTLSFWVRSSLTGTFGGSIQNSAENRSYPFTYTIVAADTWEQKFVTIPGDTSGTWVGATNGIGMRVGFGLAHGSDYQATANAWTTGYKFPTGAVNLLATNGATLYLTGVQLEAGSTATPFEYRHYTTELALCQRYYQLFTCSAVEWIYNEANGATNKFWQLYMGVPMRSAPTATYSSGMTGGAVVGFSGTISSLALVSASVNRLATRVTMSTNTGTSNLMYHCDSFDGDTVGLSSEL